MKTIYIDADACPVKKETYRVAARYGWGTFVVANQFISTPPSQIIFCIQVGDGMDEADDWIAEHVEGGDIVITADILLAARCLEKSARVLGPRGRIFKDESIGEAIAAREAQAYMREMGIQAGGPKPLEERARSNFLQKLDQVVQAVKRKA